MAVLATERIQWHDGQPSHTKNVLAKTERGHIAVMKCVKIVRKGYRRWLWGQRYLDGNCAAGRVIQWAEMPKGA